MQTLKIEYKNPTALVPSPFNSREHSDAQISQIAKSIKEFGFNKPVLIDEKNVIIAGHGAVLGAKEAKVKRIPVVILSHLSEREKRAYIIADNKLAENSTWDFEKLSTEVAALMQMDFNIETLGFDEQELDAILRNDPSILPPATTTVKEHERIKHGEGNFSEDQGNAYKTQFGVIVICEDEATQEEIFKRLTQEGHNCKIVVT